jgi:GH25 family lysozyme M1 (1,4-beta-N-acetylmuramidase)
VSYYDTVLAERALVASLQQQLQTEQTKLTTLEAGLVVGGPDVSATQGSIDWPTVKQTYDWAFVKVADGDVLDSTYSAGRVSALRSSGIGWAPYQYCRVASDSNGQRTPTTEAAMAYYFASKQGWGKSGDFPLAYDVEMNSGETTTFQGQTPAKAAAHVVGFVKAYNGLTGTYPFLYTNPSTWKLLSPQMSSDDLAVMARCPLWLASWGVSSPTVPAPWTQWTFWQYTNNGTVAGITTNPTDLNHCSLSKTELAALAIP